MFQQEIRSESERNTCFYIDITFQVRLSPKSDVVLYYEVHSSVKRYAKLYWELSGDLSTQ